MTFLKPGDTILGLDLAHGGHLTHGNKVNFSGKLYNSIFYQVDKTTGLVDFDEVIKLAREHNPKLIICGGSAYPRFIEFQDFKQIADDVGADELKFSGIDLNKQGLKILESNLGVKNLELKQFVLDSDWSILSKLKHLKSLTIRDSYIDFKKFYIAICSLPNLEFLTYNHYCFFNKNKSDRLPTNLKLPSLKKFKIEFPYETEPNFEIMN